MTNQDPGWYMPQDRLSVHLGINHRLWLCRQRRQWPVRILLGRQATRRFMHEKWWRVLPRGTFYYGGKTWQIPMVWNVKGMGPWAIAIETIPWNRRPRRTRSNPEKPQV